MTDDSEGFEPDEQVDAGDPAQAFDALRLSVEKLARDVGGEMTVIRKGVEAAFDQFEKFQQPPDYGPELGRIVKQVAVVGQALESLQKLPALRNGPDHYARALENAGDRISENAGRTIEARGQVLERVAGDLRACVRTARARRQQDWWLCGAGAAGLVFGVLLTLFAPRVLYGSLDMAVASTVLNADRWNAGIALMKSGSPGGWQSILDADSLVRANREALTACAETAAKSKKDQRCTITVAAPAQP
ncbi:MAG TPA: DUF6118 family protein [Novosphingobium sp.]|jgi:hypothetical protein|uniref:Uncharacterized protein n=1 Tax=Rhodobacter capsulatus TaxID=1061 RepID=A0A4U1JNU9_RHOCA|nr:DUF6118 family protein [Rhodobacter capsulatus]TKD17587.1 hypothetical protein FBT96_13705 [Rhodobacter capsulatus]TXH19622.1 MAG: hypothetical protein E6R00_01540 [Gammaproteobacteria bacterium]HML42907.1 DUF6118 family protein [Hyphomicrobium zavarzinii]HPB23295.1 DUF6118 family protein [Novosphingobium sp.]